MEWLYLIIGFIIGCVVVCVYFIRHKEIPVGDLWINYMNSREDPELLFTPDVHPDVIAKAKYIVLKVKVISHD